MIGDIVVCLVAAGLITYTTRSKNHVARGVKNVWVKCSNPDCGATYEVDRDEYFVYIGKNRDRSNPLATPALVCEECGEESVYLAIKCSKCSNVFFRNEAEDPDFPERCPECGYSVVEENRKKAK